MCTFVWLLTTPGIALAAMDQQPPNIIIVLADDVGFSDFGCYGGEIQTSHIDRLAKNGIRFTNFSTENKCGPSRASLLTGRYYIHGYRMGRSLDLAEGLSLRGYKSYVSGKWDGSGGVPGGPSKRGYDRFFGFIGGCGSQFTPLRLQRDGKDAESEWKSNGDFYFTHAITDTATRYIREAPKDRPFFLLVTYTAPHWPMHALPKDIEKYRGEYAEGWDVLRKRRLERMKEMGLVPKATPLPPRDPRGTAWKDAENKEWEQRRMEVYAAMIDCVDQGVGKIVQTLRETNRFENTLFIVTADNGASSEGMGKNRKGPFLNPATRDGRPIRVGNDPRITPGAEDTWQTYGCDWAFLSSTPFRLYKGFEHRGGHAEPLVMHWPRVVRKGGVISDELCHIIDIMPTAMDAAGIEFPAEFRGRKLDPLDGKSLLAVLKGKPRKGHDALYWGCIHGKAVQQGRWKLVRSQDNPWELYDMHRDRTELNDLAAQYPDKVKAMEKTWEAWRDSSQPHRKQK